MQYIEILMKTKREINKKADKIVLQVSRYQLVLHSTCFLFPAPTAERFRSEAFSRSSEAVL